MGGQFGFGGRAVDGEFLHDDGGFYIAGSFEKIDGSGLVDAGSVHDDALGSVDELGVGRLDVDHEVAVDGSGFDHGPGGEHIEHEFGGSAGLHPRAAGEDFGARDGGDGDVCGCNHGRVGDAGDCNGERSEGIGVGEGSEDVRGSTAGGDPYEHVLASEARGCEVGCALFGGVFGLLAGFAEGGVPSRDEALYESWRDGEGGWTFAGIKYTETAAGASSDVEEAASVFEAVGDLVHRFGDVGEGSNDGGDRFATLVADEAEHVESGEFVDMLGEWIAGFGEEVGEIHLNSMMHEAGPRMSLLKRDFADKNQLGFCRATGELGSRLCLLWRAGIQRIAMRNTATK